MGLAKEALQIDLRNMSYVHVAEDGKSAKVGGGATVKQLVDSLEKVGKRTGEPIPPASGDIRRSGGDQR